MNAHRYENLQTRGKIGVTAVMLLCNEDAATPLAFRRPEILATGQHCGATKIIYENP